MYKVDTGDVELSSRCMDILFREVGPVDAERFIAYINRERLDYTRWQQSLFSGMTIDEIASAARDAGERIRQERSVAQ